VKRHSTYVRAAFAVGTLILAAACGSSGSGSGAGPDRSPTSSPAGGAVELATHAGPLGTYLTDSAGRTLYLFASDTSTSSTCTGQCLTYWPPLTTTSSAHTSGRVAANLVGTIPANGAGEQVTFAGHPLYYFAQDTSPGDIAGQGSNAFGARWWLVSPSGAPITRSAAPPASTPYSNGGGY
jgi:predicted lipoprotein with Yx(FWY)xxD motif